MYQGLQHTGYTIGRLIGKGGEGQVYDVNENSGQLAKLYNEAPDTEKANKLRYMASIQKPAIHQFAAWPADVLLENSQVVGFVMKKLTGYVPLHMLFSPMDRKKLFPDKGYNFLVHVARNLASAFHKLHEEGLIIGDINEGNILVNAQGMVAFIDCDSFQIKHNTHYYYCEVGVPRYTPPELLAGKTFTNVIRTVNTDAFSLAILIFQLLFLGRHPFAGINRSKEDFDEEKAIREHQFAYSTHNANKKLQPALNSLDITHLGTGVTELFHQAFEQDINRPLPAAWIQQLDVLGKNMLTCARFKQHTYPAAAPQCPWCYFKEQKGILFFLDSGQPTAAPLPGDIQQFVNGFQLPRLNLKKLPENYTIPATINTTIDAQWNRYRQWHLLSLVGCFLATLVSSVITSFNALYIMAWATSIALLYKFSPWRKKIRTEQEKVYQHFTTGHNKLIALVKMHNQPTELTTYHKNVQQLTGSIEAFRNLPNLFHEKKKELEEQLYHKQLLFFLCAFNLADYAIPGFGTAKKQLLHDNNIRNAADISQLHSIKINSIGPKNLQLLFDWQRQMSANFTYRPNYDLIGKETLKLANDIEKEKAGLEKTIKQQYQQLLNHQSAIITRQQTLEAQYNRLLPQVMLAEVNYNAIKELL